MTSRIAVHAPPVAAGGVFFLFSHYTGISLGLLAASGIIAASLTVFIFLLRKNSQFCHPVLLFVFGMLISGISGEYVDTLDSRISLGQGSDDIESCRITLVKDPLVLKGKRWMGEGLLIACHSDTLNTTAIGRIIMFGSGSVDGLGWGCVIDASGQIRSGLNSGRPEITFSVESWETVGWKNRILAVRYDIVRVLETSLKNFDEDTKNYMSALLLGRRTDPGSAIIRGFRNAGCMHLLALSGFHLGLIAILSMKVFRGLAGFRASRILTLAVVTVYLLIAGFRPSLLRAWIMFAIWSIASLQHRKLSALGVISMSFILQCVFMPRYSGGIGFYLSYAALLGILTLGSCVDGLLRRRLGRSLSGIVAAGYSAQGFTLPFVVESFGIWRPIGIIASPIITPLLIVSMVYGSILVFLDVSGLSVPRVFWALGNRTVAIIEYMADSFGRVRGVKMTLLQSWLPALCIAIIPILVSRRLRYELPNRSESRFPCLNPIVSRQSRTGTPQEMGTEFPDKPGCPGKNSRISRCGRIFSHMGNRTRSGSNESKHSR